MRGKVAGSTYPPLPLVTAWLGGGLTYLERLCLTAMVHVGHETILYCYDDLEGVPAGVEVRDAAQIMPREEFICVNGSFAIGSDLFRYRLLSRVPCIWIDADMLLLRPIRRESDYVFGWEDERYINTAVLGMPGDSSVLAEIASLISQRPFFAPWWEGGQRDRQREAVRRGAPLQLAELPWATTGPKMITYLAVQHGVARHARASDAYYPVHWRDHRLPFDRGDRVVDMLTDATVGVHLWNHMLGRLKLNPAPDSFVARQCHLHGIDLPFGEAAGG